MTAKKPATPKKSKGKLLLERNNFPEVLCLGFSSEECARDTGMYDKVSAVDHHETEADFNEHIKWSENCGDFIVVYKPVKIIRRSRTLVAVNV